jgi:hypothetical protein
VSPLEDQVFAGALMWVFGTFIYTVPAVMITVRLLSSNTAPTQNETAIQLRKLASHAYEHSQAEVV